MIEKFEGGVSRRAALKGGLVGAAAVWATPTVLSMATPAAAGSVILKCDPATGGNCNPDNPCGGGCATGGCTGGVGCFSVMDTEGNCFCAQGVGGCACLTVPCSSSSQCGPGQACIVQSCCPGPSAGQGFCYDPCGVNCH